MQLVFWHGKSFLLEGMMNVYHLTIVETVLDFWNMSENMIRS